jgi:hypothetical protein
VGEAVRPSDIVDWLLVKDVVALTWEVQRSRRLRDSLVRLARGEAMEELLAEILRRDGAERELGGRPESARLAIDWLAGNRNAARRIEALLARAGLSLADVGAQALTLRADEAGRQDAQAERHERRRDAILQQIERRRAGWARWVRQATEDVVDAEFEERAPALAAAEPAGGAHPR